jgi:hypothetical protein
VITSALSATSRIVRLISSSVSESSDDVASSNTRRCGSRRRARAMESRCFSPPEIFMPPSPITVSRPLVGAAEERRRGGAAHDVEALLVGRLGAHEERFSRIVPLNSCASCVTKPMRSRNLSRSIRSLPIPL